MKNQRPLRSTAARLCLPLIAFALAWPEPALAQTAPLAVRAQVDTQLQPYLHTLKSLVGIESGSRDLEGLAQLAGVVEARLKATGMTTQRMPTKAPDFHPQLKGTVLGDMVYATRQGTGKRSVLLIAHMDTVYTRGMGAKQPFRVDGDRAYGLGIADDKSGVALILHAVALLDKMGFKDYAKLGVLINGDEEIGSPGSGAFITQLGSEYDAVLSFEGGGGADSNFVRLATSSIAIAEMRVTGRAAHAGANPAAGRNALYELAHQMLKTRDFGDPSKGLQIHWTVASAGDSRNVIPASAMAIGDVRSLTNLDLDLMEKDLRAAIQNKLIPDTKIELDFYRSRPAFVPNEVSRVLARHALAVYQEIGAHDGPALTARDRATGGGTDAAFAGLRPKGGVLESFGARGYGAHSNDNEYIFVNSIMPRLYLATRMVMDVGSGAVAW